MVFEKRTALSGVQRAKLMEEHSIVVFCIGNEWSVENLRIL